MNRRTLGLVATLTFGGVLLPMSAQVGAQDKAAVPDRSAMQKDSAKLSKQDKKFAMEAATIGMAEVAAGKLAGQNGTAPVKEFGQHMVKDHSMANDKLMQLASGKGIELPQQVDKKHQKMADKMAKLSGAKFDKEYVDAQIKDHKKAIKLFEEQAEDGKDPALNQFAQETLPTLQAHLKMAQDLQKKIP